MEAIASVSRVWRCSLLGFAITAMLAVATGCGDPDPAPAESASLPHALQFPVHTRPVPGVPHILVGAGGAATKLACATCHSMKRPDPTQRGGAGLRKFHQGLKVAHGNLTCLSCHHPDDYNTLRLADGRHVPFERVMELCAQCHGPQARDYAHGAHGGMSGYWDRTRGTQVRNQCTHCHAPHAPAYPSMQPTFKPRDRFLPVRSESHDD
jgi:hypothetical protein